MGSSVGDKIAASSNLLFFDTFSHETSDVMLSMLLHICLSIQKFLYSFVTLLLVTSYSQLQIYSQVIQLDLVQFPKAVQVSEVRVIPLGARVKADFPGGVRLGATNPSQFEIEFFVNDLSKRGAATFENIGSLQYTQHGNIQLEFDKKPPTDGLLLRGSYNTVTLAVYGNITKVQRDPSPPKPQPRPEIVPQPPPEKVNTNERIRDWLEDTKRKQHAYEINPSEEDPPEWDPKPPSPIEFEDGGKEWRESNRENTREFEREKEKRESREKTRSREKSWDRDRSERGSSRRESSKRDGSRDKEKEREKVIEREKEKQGEKETKIMRRSRDFEDNLSGFDISSSSKRKRSLDEWDDHRSDRSEERSAKRPRTPLESPVPPPPSESPASELGGGGGRIQVLPPPILSDEMEAISDNEDIPDLPAEDEAPEFGEEHVEEEDQLVVVAAPIEETPEEADVCEYEEIMSDEDDLPEYQYVEDYLIDEWEDWIKPFSPQDVVELPELLVISQPMKTPYELEVALASSCKSKELLEDKYALGNKLGVLVNETPLPTLVINKTLDADVSQDVPEETGEIWVQAVEHVCQLLPKALVYISNQKVFKIRHMKAGIRLCNLLLQCSSDISLSLLERGVLGKLFVLNEQQHLALSIRLTIFRRVASSAILRKVHLLEMCEKFRSDVFDLIGFGSITDGAKCGPPEVEKLEKKSPSFSENGNANTDEDAMPNDNEDDDKIRDSPLWNFNLPASLLHSMLSCLKEVTRLFIYANQLLVQPIRWLPGSKQFQLPKHSENPYLVIYNIFKRSRFLEAISVLLVTPSTSQKPSLLEYIKSFLNSLLCSEHGIRFLACDTKSSLIIIKALLQFGEESRISGCEGESLFHLGVQMSTKLHVVHQLDCIAALGGPLKSIKRVKLENGGISHDVDNSLDYSQAAVHFNCLESLLMSPVGKESIISVIGSPYFMKILLPYLIIDIEEETPENHPTKAACFGYAVDLLTIAIKFQNDAQILKQHAEYLCNVIASFDKATTKSEDCIKLCEILPWLAVGKNSDVFTYDKLSILSNTVQDNLEKLEKFPGELFSTLRILCYLTIPQTPVGEFNSEDHNNELIEELKYKYAATQLFSFDLHTHLINLLSKLFNMYQQPFLHSSNFVGSEGGLVVMLIKPSLALLETILGFIIKARNADFKDLTAIVPLVQTYILLQAFPTSSPYHSTSQKLKQKVINILLGYTQVKYTTEGEEVLTKSLWTHMMTEIFKYLMNAPHTMVSVITLITELLPLPLPIQTQVPLTQEETEYAVRLRKLWSAHLYSLASTLQELIHRLGLATHPLLTHSLRRMCVALSDLSAPMALLVAKATLDLLLQTHRLDQRTSIKEEMKSGKDDLIKPSSTPPRAYASQQTTRALNMLASLVSHAPTKAAVLHLLRGGAPTLTHTSSKTDEKYSSLVGTWCGILNLPSRASDQNQAHLGAQECLVMIFHYLLDYENAMQVNQEEIKQEENDVGFEYSLTGVPHKDVLVPLIEALIDSIRSSQVPFTLIRNSIRVLLHLLEHNYGFYYVKSVLDKKKGSLFSTLRNLSLNFNKESADCLALLKDVLYLCQLLIYPDESRNQVLSVVELSVYLGWRNNDGGESYSTRTVVASNAEKRDGDLNTKVKKDEDDKDTKEQPQEEKKEEETTVEKTHPLKVLEHLVISEGKDEEETEHLYDEISQLISLLEKEGSQGLVDNCDIEEPSPVGLESLQVLFASRVVWTFPSAEDDLHSLWFTPPSFEDIEEKDAVSVNLLEICRKYVGDFDLLGTLRKVVKGQASHSISPQKITKAVPKYKPSATAIRPDRRGRPYVAPLRGRSFGRGINIRSDPFRSRPPNTSRPPSLHVDDFVALESTGHQPTGPTGYNKISFGRGKMMLDSMRARGRVRGDNRGRFFHRPLFRGDGRVLGRGIGIRRPGWVFRGDGSPRGNFRGSPLNSIPPRFIRGRPFVRVPGLPGGPKERFAQKFIERGRREVAGGRHLRGFR
ncbi:Protein virilizer-like protein [Armadillidium nasatum]|uniref:Protein virilizer-like protein n=1 Tax=Armadillidium nasatum TaxID=96803 RepID=A0A5N5SK12_9CRUS|nr:Protein virilizer-like protein [Armadillidium nasatum]